MSAVCKQLILFPAARLKYIVHFLSIGANASQLWKLFFLISKGCNFSEVKFLLEISFEGPFCLCIVLASPFREIALVSVDYL